MVKHWSIFKITEPAHEIIVLITQATSEGSGEPHWMAALANWKNEFTGDEKCHNLMRWLNYSKSFRSPNCFGFYRMEDPHSMLTLFHPRSHISVIIILV